MLRTALLLSGFGLITLTGLLTSAPAAAQDRGWNGPSITCSSNDNRRRECDTPFRGRAVLVENISGTRCIEGRNWGSDRGRVWVDNGCRARFVDGRNGSGGGWGGNNGGAGGVAGTVRCESNDQRQKICDTGWRRAMLVRQLSNTPCVEGRNWRQDGGRIWVDDGCRGEFAQARGGGWDRGDGGYGGRDDRPRNDYAISCASDDRRLRTCAWDGRYGRPVLTRQLSDTRCEEGRSWGYDERRATVWVNDGCRARFEAR
ncbi:DUF3011 domain-containing protein [Xanthomonas hortorum]|uniref:DUF3011 domain-containing protein n=2 Tax=Xanthomonas hortorum TaxID=56454 RepID=A0A6V7CBS7_9XANT|nr:DUF3011 domain-containing protein [Xanthomonas hortorum]MCC4623286.1 DUF3011 domain-containing protein [Xanthomonas campestris pv. nigromaculans]APP81573.1 hypothetical protein BJD10_19410 [Xanthomonas hortorum pv. gardneri]EGD17946.1 hypothetical protein XGA_3450 [Xanthomonas hortorum ATCC 19865]KLA95185.1 hypothetical protein SM17710_18290 [Xanthomonas hortorum pv. gardneri]KLA98042.1 hypothetical protein SM19410_09240 [Xanthomonas hortorum pv. gardneri]